ncbi:MAG: hypothetical protein LQ352_007947 [Teloschistes flavicans]|nr:MAG: hypothetical protein LQ352_007947 [Teloschistes flavicans]
MVVVGVVEEGVEIEGEEGEDEDGLLESFNLILTLPDVFFLGFLLPSRYPIESFRLGLNISRLDD